MHPLDGCRFRQGGCRGAASSGYGQRPALRGNTTCGSQPTDRIPYRLKGGAKVAKGAVSDRAAAAAVRSRRHDLGTGGLLFVGKNSAQ